MFVVKSADIEFVSPARFDDLLCVTAEVKKTRRASLHFNQQCKIIESASGRAESGYAGSGHAGSGHAGSGHAGSGHAGSGHAGSGKSNEGAGIASGGDLVASANIVIACLDADSFKPSAIPGHLKTVLNH